jgi:hypothetical protein
MTLQVDFASFARAIFKGTAIAVTDYTVSNMFLCYEVLEVPGSLIEAERHAIQSSPFVMPLTSWMNTQVTTSVLNSYNLGLNTSSLRAVYVLPLGSTGYANNAATNYVRPFDDEKEQWGSGVDFKVYLDGSIKNSSINSDPVMQFTMLKQALHNSVQANVHAPGKATFAEYNANYNAVGVDCLSFDDDASLFGGSSCTNLNIQAQKLKSASNDYLSTVLICYDSILAISGDGLCEVKR